jgi:hypothetical protein
MRSLDSPLMIKYRVGVLEPQCRVLQDRVADKKTPARGRGSDQPLAEGDGAQVSRRCP